MKQPNNAPEPGSLDGQVHVVTGPTSGIGRVTAHALARGGATVVLACRDLEKGAAVRARLDGEGHVVHLDLASFASVRRAAEEIRDRWDRVDVLVNNAGFFTSERTRTEDGHEQTWQVNHLGPFLFTNLLRGRIARRVVTVASHAHYRGRIHWEDPDDPLWLMGWGPYCQSKLANVLFSMELARRLEGSGVTSNSLHPGVVASGFAQGEGVTGVGMRVFGPFLMSPERGAETSIHLAASPEVADVSGAYFSRCRPVTPSRAARDREAQQRLWRLSAQQVGLEKA